MNMASESARPGPSPNRNLLLLLTVAFGLMGTQLVLPVGGVPAADAIAGIAFLAVLLHLWRGGGEVSVPAPLPAVLIAYALANLAARSHLPGAVEVVQRVVYLFCGTILLGMLLKYRPHWALWAMCSALGANLLVALVQGIRFGFGSTLPPLDVLGLPLGFGGAYSGLFRSRIALALFAGMALVWLQPFAYQLARTWKGWLAVLLGTALVLGFVAHGQILLVIAAVAVLFGFIHSRKAGLANLGALILLALTLQVGGRGTVLAESTTPLANRYGTLKPGHIELVPAFRLANQHPLRGVGSANYQRRIGDAYRLLPRENVNDMEADSQAGYGILFATVGYPAGFFMVALLLWGMGLGIRSFLTGPGDPRQLGGGALLGVVLGAMWITDPFTKGNSWFIALGLASVWSAGALLVLDLKRLIVWGAGLGLLAGLVVLAGKPAEEPARRPATAARTAPAWSSGAYATHEFLRVLDAEDALEIGPPMRRESDSQAAKNAILHIPENSGVPPSEAEAAMAHGGARFEVEVPEDMECMVWVRVWWADSCSNTVFVKVGDDGHPMRVGGDGTYEAWHWMPTPEPVQLAKGTNTIYLLNREDGIRFDQMLITDDLEYHPQGIEEDDHE